MTLRSSTFLREQLQLRKAIERDRLTALGGEPDRQRDPLDYYAHRRAIAIIGDMESELAATPDAALEITFDGRDIHDGTIALRRLGSLIVPIGQTMRQTARDVAARDGDEAPPGGNLADIAEPVLAGTFPSSFGVRIVRAPVSEQGSLLNPTLFDRTADRVMEVFRVAEATPEPANVLEALSGLRYHALMGFLALARTMTLGGTSRLRWRGEEVVAVPPASSAAIVEALTNVTIEEETREVIGRLSGGDVRDQRFHLHVDHPEPGMPSDYRGGVESEVLARLRFDSLVIATIMVTATASDYLARPRETYVLTEIREMGT